MTLGTQANKPQAAAAIPTTMESLQPQPSETLILLHTNTLSPTSTLQPTRTNTPTQAPTATGTSTQTPTFTPTSTPEPPAESKLIARAVREVMEENDARLAARSSPASDQPDPAAPAPGIPASHEPDHSF